MQMSWKIFGIFVLQVQLSYLVSSDVCQLKGKDLIIHRNYKTGETTCCLNVKCIPGEEAVICERDDPRSTRCRRCPDGTYQPEATDSVDMLHCTAKTQCYGNLSMRYEKSKTRDTQCFCDTKIGFCNPNGSTKNPRFCVKKTCPQGFALTSKCTCEVCIKPANKSRTGQKPCDNRHELCKNQQETSTSKLDSSTMCPEDNLETTSKQGTMIEKNINNKNSGTTSPYNIVANFSSLISSRLISGRDDVTSDRQDEQTSLGQVNTSVPWYVIFICVTLAVVGLFVIISMVLMRKGFCHAEPVSSSSIPKSASAVSNSTDDTELDDVVIESTKAESLSLMPPPVLSRSTEADAVKDNDLMKPSDKEKLTTQRLNLVENLVLNESLWSVLLSNETVTPEMKTKIERSSASDQERAGALITYLLKRNSRAFETFIAALIVTKQEHLAKALDSTLTKKIKQERPGDY